MMSHFKKIIRQAAEGKADLKIEIRKFLQNLPKIDDTKIYDGR